MRQTTITSILFLLVCMGVSPLHAQVTIDHNNFSAKTGFVDNYHNIEATESIIPEGGANMVWDYSGIAHETATTVQQEFHDATNDPDFPTALHYRETILNFNAFDIPQKAYREVSESGYSQIGSKIEENSFSITAFSGGPDDVLRFPYQVVSFEGGEGKNEYLRFPMNYQDQWSSTTTNDTDFELTVAAFGLNQTPGLTREIGTDNVEVIGYGQVIIPMEDGSASNPVEVLLVKTISSRVTNYFLGGAPAPEALLNAFGLVQGEEVINEPFYSFYRPGFSEPVLRVFSDRYTYRPQAVPPQPTMVINREDFTREAGFIDESVLSSTEGFTLPSEGENQVWDYTSIPMVDVLNTEYVDETNNPDFPNALNSFQSDLFFQGLPIPTRTIEIVDEEGWGYIGKSVTDISHSITPISGGADDVLRFVGGNTVFDERINRVEFPLTDQSEWTNSRTELINIELTVGAFGLNQVPGFLKRIHTHHHEAVGYGTLRIPTEDGSASEPMEAILLKVTESAVDSFYIGGAVAPDALTAAFGLTQGVSLLTPFTYYAFYTPGFGTHAMRINLNEDESQAVSVYYRPKAGTATMPNFIIEREDFTREAGFTDEAIRASIDGFSIPNVGDNQAWDYTSMLTEEVITTEYTDETNNSDFPNALNSFQTDLFFQGLPIPTRTIETVDEDGWGYIGKSVTDVSYPIATLTGGADDVLRFVGGNTLYDERINRLQFPTTDLSKWTDSRTELIDYELTVAAFGLNQVPGFLKRIHTHTHEAVGYGTLRIPTEDGSPSEPLDVLLLKVTESAVDSFFLAGAVAPDALTAAFGLTQGEGLLTVSTYYAFYTPDFGLNVMRVNVNEEGEVISVFYRPQAAATSTEPINISHNRVCDVPSEGQSQVTVTITGGTAPYQVSGNFNGEVEENESFIFILDDNETGYDIIVVDADGNESQVFESDLIPCTKLPVELLSFEGKIKTEGNLLQWTTASELNNQHFKLSYSINGQIFIPLQKMAGNGTTSTENSYSFLHRSVPKGTIYYQLSQTDFDGTTKNLGTISLKRGETTGISAIEVYPTATSHQLNVSYNFAGQANTTTLKVYDMTGRVVKKQNLDSSALQFQLNIADLNTGTYLLQIENGVEILSSRFVKF